MYANQSSTNIGTNQVTNQLDVFRAFIEDRILGNMNGGLAITKTWNKQRDLETKIREKMR